MCTLIVLAAAAAAVYFFILKPRGITVGSIFNRRGSDDDHVV
jgi:hypothetical protein